MRKSNLTYEQLIELAPKDRPFQIEVEMSSGISYGKQLKWTYLYNDDDLWTIFDKNGSDFWKTKYKGSFTLIDKYRNMYEKPEVLEVGTEVEILESAKEIEEGFKQETYIGKIGRIQLIQDDYRGLWYGVVFDESNRWIGFPHYCVRPVEKVEEKEEIITVNGKKYKLIEE